MTAEYSYDYRKIKPRKAAYISFDKVIGRKCSDGGGKNPPYSYNHYEYNDYVWNGKSNVFTNTKTHVADFNKQTNR